jgi:hypothetical protein
MRENESIHERIEVAAKNAIIALQKEAKVGRSFMWHIHYVANKLREVYLRFNDRITRKAVLSSHGDGNYFQQEEGPFFLFVEAVLAPLNRFLADLPSDSGKPAKRLSAEYVVKRAVAASASSGLPIIVHN